MPLLPLALATAALAQILDLGTFVAMVQRHGLAAEANPVVTSLVGDYGLPIAAIAEVALLALIVAITLVLTQRTGRVDRLAGAAVVVAGILAGIVGGASNVLTMGPL